MPDTKDLRGHTKERMGGQCDGDRGVVCTPSLPDPPPAPAVPPPPTTGGHRTFRHLVFMVPLVAPQFGPPPPTLVHPPPTPKEEPFLVL